MNLLSAAHADCPKCDPSCPELDEDGRPYTCYFCCDTGRVSAAAAAAYWQDVTDAAEYKRLAPVMSNGKHVRWVYCEHTGEADPIDVPLFPRSVHGAFMALHPIARPAPALIGGDDDIPF